MRDHLLQKLIISAPFGNYVSHPAATPTVGTYTLRFRAGPLVRLWRAARTIRYYRRAGAWINRLGLPNPGVDSLRGADLSGKVLSVHGLAHSEWALLAEAAALLRPSALELNLSCPNVDAVAIADAVRAYESSREGFAGPIIAKLSPVRWMDFAVPLFAAGARHFHLCNTIPTPGGGVSGKPLKPFALWAVADVKARWGGAVKVIGGGGVTGPDDARDYLAAGADRVAVGSLCFHPFHRSTLSAIARVLDVPGRADDGRCPEAP